MENKNSESYVEIHNETKDEFRTVVSEINEDDWDGIDRPDLNFCDVTVKSGESTKKCEKMNAETSSCNFMMTVTWSETEQASFRITQHRFISESNQKSEFVITKDGRYMITSSVSRSESTYRFYIRNINWMCRVPDDTLITALTIPGTHDSGTANGPQPWSIGMPLSSYIISQDMSIKEQLVAGRRVLDIRCKNNADNFGIRHGIFEIVDIDFDSVLKDCTDFLEEFPSEIILMILKEEGEPRNATLSFTEVFASKYVTGYPWYKHSDLPSFSPANRGKIVLLNRFDKLFTEYGFILSVRDNNFTDDSYGTIKYHIQDVYQINWFMCSEKVNNVVELFNIAAVSNIDELFINFASGSNIPSTIYSTAHEVNSSIYEKYKNSRLERFGIIFMDFPPQELIEVFIKSNSSTFAAAETISV